MQEYQVMPEEQNQQDKTTEVNDVAPSSLRHLIGQNSVTAQVAVALEAAWADQKRFDHALLVGPSGCGKSATANVIAKEMAADLHEVLGQSIKSAADMNALLLSAGEKSVIHIDECHFLSKEHQTALYLACDQRRLCVSSGRGRSLQSIPLGDFTLLLSTTDEFSLLEPLRNRMRLMLRFEFYTGDELTELLRQRIKALKWEVEDQLLPGIAVRSRGTPRLSLRLLQASRRVARAEGETVVKGRHLERACTMEEIDDLGLGPTERQYLKIIKDGPSRLNVIASMLGLPPRTVSLVTESYLIRAGLLAKDDTGRRQLTAKGHEHVARSSP
jgi:Holliday junction DNA helicase RuvB